MTSLTATRPSVQRRKPRFCRLARSAGGALTLMIRQQLSARREQVDTYALSEIGADQGRGFALTKAPDGTRYDVCVGGREDSCDCPGHLQHGHKTICKHRAALAKLIAAGKL